MGFLKSFSESHARAKEATGQPATLERWAANMHADLEASEAREAQARQGRAQVRAQEEVLRKHREQLKADQDEHLEKLDRIQNPEKYVEIDRLRKEAEDRETREEAAQEIAQELQKPEWDDRDRWNFLFFYNIQMAMRMKEGKELALRRAIADKPGNERLKEEGIENDIEAMQQFMDVLLKVKSPRPLTAAHMRDVMGVELAPQNAKPKKSKKGGLAWKLTKYLLIYPFICIVVVLIIVGITDVSQL